MNRRIVAVVVLLFMATFITAQDKDDALELYRTGRYEEAIEACRMELAEMPNRMDAWSVLGWSLLKTNAYQEAFDAAAEALKIARYDPRIIEIAGESLFYLGKQRQALGYFEEYAAIAPTGVRIEAVYFFMGEIFIKQGKFNRADIALSTAVYHSPNVADWWARLGYAREKAGDFRYSLEAYEKALTLNPNLVDAQRGRARVKQLSGG